MYIFLDSLQPADVFWESCGFAEICESSELHSQYKALENAAAKNDSTKKFTGGGVMSDD
jgi:hypothetical protein